MLENWELEIRDIPLCQQKTKFSQTNGTIKGTILLDVEQVIGGKEYIGQGWKMLQPWL